MDKQKLCLGDFTLLSIIGYGSYSKVALVRKKGDQRVYAMKIIKKRREVKGVKKAHAYIERDILQSVSHPFIVSFHSSFQDEKRLFFIL